MAEVSFDLSGVCALWSVLVLDWLLDAAGALLPWF
jgi:hypothetical protein